MEEFAAMLYQGGSAAAPPRSVTGQNNGYPNGQGQAVGQRQDRSGGGISGASLFYRGTDTGDELLSDRYIPEGNAQVR